MHAVTAAQESERNLSWSDERTVLRRSAGLEKDTREHGEVALCETYVVDGDDNVLEYIPPLLDPVDEASVQELRDLYDRVDPLRALRSSSSIARFLGDTDESSVAAYALTLLDLWKERRGVGREANTKRSAYAVPQWLV